VTLEHVGCQDDSGFSVLWETLQQDVQYTSIRLLGGTSLMAWWTDILTTSHEGKLHTNTLCIPCSQGPQEGATLFYVVEQFDMILASHCQVMLGG
jgi:hypothetical protein